MGAVLGAAVGLGMMPGAIAAGPVAAATPAPPRAAAPAVAERAATAERLAAEPAATQAADKDLIPSKFTVEPVATGLNLSLDGSALAVDSAGNLYVPDPDGYRVDIFDAARFRGAQPGQPLFLSEPDRTFTGTATARCSYGSPSSSRCFSPGSLAIGPGDALYVMQRPSGAPDMSSDMSIARYPKAVVAAGSGAPDAEFGGPLGNNMTSPFVVARNGDVWATFANVYEGMYGFDGSKSGAVGPAWEFQDPNWGFRVEAAAVDTTGTVWVYDSNTGRILGFAKSCWQSAGCTAPTRTGTGLTGIQGMAFDQHGNLYAGGAAGVTVIGSAQLAQPSFTVSNPYVAKDADAQNPAGGRAIDPLLDGAGNLFAVSAAAGGPRLLYWKASSLGIGAGSLPQTGPNTYDASAHTLSRVRNIALDQAGRLYVADAVGNNITVLDPNDPNKLLGRIPLANTPTAMAFSPTGDLWVIDDNGSGLKFDKALLPGGVPVSAGVATPNATIGGFQYGVGAGFSPSGDLYIADYDSLAVYGAAGLAANPTAPDRVIQGPFSDGAYGVGFTATGTMYVAETRSVWAYSASALKEATPEAHVLRGFDWATSVQVDQYGNLFVADQGHIEVYSRVELGETKPKPVETIPGIDSAAILVLHGDSVWAMADGGTVYRIAERKFVPAPSVPKGGHSKVVKVRAGQKRLVLAKGGHAWLRASAYRENGKATDHVKWASSNKSVATVSVIGIVRAKKAGKTVVTISAGGKKTHVTVTVLKRATAGDRAKKVTAKVKRKLKAGQTTYVTGAWSPSKAVGIVLKYASSNKKVVVIDKGGRLVAKRAGVARIQVRARGASRTYKIKVVRK
ncbi:MAG: Ig-like domain-containing protein [Bifidobacteriaceae bacterium]|jgi:sugar lactone lactonase YvrE|nr:Ig-like domain-containing protein [Bifidobacteriaceae bacterium]